MDKRKARDKLKLEIDNVMKDLVLEYVQNERLILTESDLVNRAFFMLQNDRVVENFNLAIHSELRPFKGNLAIREERWQSVKPITYAAKCDLVLISQEKKYWKKSYAKVLEYQGKGGTGDLQYWRFLAYPLEAFKAVFEFKIRVKGNAARKKKGFRKDLTKLSLIRCKNPDCLTYFIVLDRKGTAKEMNKIKTELNTEGLRLFTNIKSNEYRSLPCWE